jgi:SAM-dependent methyltransferase
VTLAGTGFVKLILNKPSRPYEEGSVGKEYDEWTELGYVEYYRGEHIHLGYYSKEEKYRKKPLREAQYTFIDEMMKFGGIDPATDSEAKVLDVGCGFGGTKSDVTGIALSPQQIKHGTELAIEQETPNAKFMHLLGEGACFPGSIAFPKKMPSSFVETPFVHAIFAASSWIEHQAAISLSC